MSYLEKAHMSPNGLLDFMKKLQAQEGSPITGDNKYLIDHPPTQDRVEAIAYGFDHSPYAKSKLPPEIAGQVDGFLGSSTPQADTTSSGGFLGRIGDMLGGNA